jgi:hypothetical protein
VSVRGRGPGDDSEATTHRNLMAIPVHCSATVSVVAEVERV